MARQRIDWAALLDRAAEQVELDALPPDQLGHLYREAIYEFWDDVAYETAVERERNEAASLSEAS